MYALANDFSLKMPFLTILAFHSVDEYQEAVDMSLEPRFEAFDADVGFPQLSSASYPKLRFKNASRPMELESGWNGHGRGHREGMN